MTHSTHSAVVNAFGVTDLGKVRKNNEDSFIIAGITDGFTAPNTAEANQNRAANGSIFLVADGMGGSQAGEVASRMAVELVATNFVEQLRRKKNVSREMFIRILQTSVHEANQKVRNEARQNDQLTGMGTTLTAAAVHLNSIFFAQLGDSRAYLLRNGYIVQMTKDQSLVAQLLANGSIKREELKTHPRRNVILQALGIQSQVNVVVSCADLKRDDRLVICSDGLWGKVEDEEIKDYVEMFDPPTACHELVRVARERGGEDNITVIVAQFNGEGLSAPINDEVLAYQNFKEQSRWKFWPFSKST